MSPDSLSEVSFVPVNRQDESCSEGGMKNEQLDIKVQSQTSHSFSPSLFLSLCGTNPLGKQHELAVNERS